MNSNVRVTEFLFETCPDLLMKIVDAFGNVFDFFMQTLRELLESGLESSGLPAFFVTILNNVLERLDFVLFGVNVLDTPLLFVMLGTGLYAYLVYQLIIWVLNLIT